MPAEDDKKNSITSVDLDLGREEFEYVEIDCMPLVDIGAVSLQLTVSKSFPGRAELLVEENYRLLSRDVIKVESGRTPNLHVAGDETSIRQARRRIMQLLVVAQTTYDQTVERQEPVSQ